MPFRQPVRSLEIEGLEDGEVKGGWDLWKSGPISAHPIFFQEFLGLLLFMTDTTDADIDTLLSGGSMGRLEGKVAIVTGGSTGFGYAIAELFAREGAKVMIAARRKEKGIAADEKIRSLTRGEVKFLQCDVTKEAEVRELAHKAMEIYHRIDVLVNNAGMHILKDFEDTTEEEWDEVMNANVKGIFFCCKHIIPLMVKNGKGSVINLSSVVGLVGKGEVPIYSASKGGVTLLTRSLALRYAKQNIRVNCICPATIITDLNRKVVEKADDPEKKLKELESAIPLGRLGTVMDVAYAAVYLASDESQWVTGIALPLDGGFSAG